MDLATAIAAEGVRHLVEAPGWRTRGRPGFFRPGAIARHGDASRTWHGSRGFLNAVINGTATLAGPLYNVFIERDGTVHVVAAGRANHFGMAHFATVRRALLGQHVPYLHRPGPDSLGVNGYLWAVAVANDNLGEPSPPAQRDSLIRVCAGIARAEGWTANHSLEHRHGTRRKIDRGTGLADVRAAVAQRLRPTTPPPTPAPPKETDMRNAVILRRQTDASQWACLDSGVRIPLDSPALVAFALQRAGQDRVLEVPDRVVNAYRWQQ